MSAPDARTTSMTAVSRVRPEGRNAGHGTAESRTVAHDGRHDRRQRDQQQHVQQQLVHEDVTMG
eukprot:2711522-Heterocapsa_arctica.AAC.1